MAALVQDDSHQRCALPTDIIYWDISNKSKITIVNNILIEFNDIIREQWKENNGGSDRIRNEVGSYEDEYQREQCYMVMEVLGYTYNEECGHFLKPGVKEYIDGKLNGIYKTYYSK